LVPVLVYGILTHSDGYLAMSKNLVAPDLKNVFSILNKKGCW